MWGEGDRHGQTAKTYGNRGRAGGCLRRTGSRNLGIAERARHTAARTVNSILTATYWEIGRRIVEYEQGGGATGIWGSPDQTYGKRPAIAAWPRFLASGLYKMRAFYLGADCPDSVGTIRSQGNIPDTVGNISAGCGIPVRPSADGRADLPDTVGRIRNCADTVCRNSVHAG